MGVQIIRTPRLILREFTSHDLEALHAVVSDREVIRFMPTTEPWPEDTVQMLIERVNRHWVEHGFGCWAVDFQDGGELLGWCGLNLLSETDEVEIKYLLKRSHWGVGLATEAARPCLEHAFGELNLETIVGLVHPDNRASQRVLEKIGLTFRNKARYFGNIEIMCR
jgi:ribosomal-protein-alanine N-acetyltransferase